MRVLRQCLLLALYLFECQYYAISISASYEGRSELPLRSSCQGKVIEERLCVPDGVTSTETDPLWDRSVLLLRFRKLDLGAERLVALYENIISWCSSTICLCLPSRICHPLVAIKAIHLFPSAYLRAKYHRPYIPSIVYSNSGEKGNVPAF
jgi:hypothetical protein